MKNTLAGDQPWVELRQASRGRTGTSWLFQFELEEGNGAPLYVEWTQIRHPAFTSDRRDLRFKAPRRFQLPVRAQGEPGQLESDVLLEMGVIWRGQEWFIEIPLNVEFNQKGYPETNPGRSKATKVDGGSDTPQVGRAGMDRPPRITPDQEALLRRLVQWRREGPEDEFLLLEVMGAPPFFNGHDDTPVSRADVEQLASKGYLFHRIQGTGHFYSVTAEGHHYIEQKERGGLRESSEISNHGGSTHPEGSMALGDKSRTLFVVHGRDQKARNGLFQLLRAVDLKPLEWEQARKLTGKASPYVGEVVETALDHAQAIVVLFTGDDLAHLRPDLTPRGEEPETPQPQPRPNVIFEAGMALAKNPDRTVIVQIGRIREISDLLGRHVVRLDDTPERRKALLSRLHDAGCPVDYHGDDWLKAGKFSDIARASRIRKKPGQAPRTTESSFSPR